MNEKASPVIGVGAVVFHDNKVLLVKRQQQPNAGQWAIPGGRLRFGETLQQAAEREILEETGVRIRAGQPIYTFEIIETADNGEPTLHYVVIDLAASYIDGHPIPADDAADARWFEPEELDYYPINETTRKLLASYPDFVLKK
jgi:ADP-ribose pyrophosphatase